MWSLASNAELFDATDHFFLPHWESACLRKLEKENEGVAEIVYSSSFGETDLNILYVHSHISRSAWMRQQIPVLYHLQIL